MRTPEENTVYMKAYCAKRSKADPAFVAAAAERTARWRRDNPEAYAIRSREDRWRSMGIAMDWEAYTALHARQGGKCVCGQPLSLSTPPKGTQGLSVAHVDHDHETGAVRGLLCQKCNQSLGMVSDDPSRLMRLAAYLMAAPLATALGGG